MYIENKQLKNYISFWLISMFWIISLMIVVGGLTRLTDSGLSITEWQLFAGFFPPINEAQWLKYFDLYKKIPEFKLQNYTMTLQEFKIIFWWEWTHRFLGRLIGLTFLIPLIYFSLKIGFRKLKNFFLIFFLICFQGFIGWYMVSSGLEDSVDVSHFRLSVHLLIAFLIGYSVKGINTFNLDLYFYQFNGLNGALLVIGNIIPGLIASWMDRQGVLRTTCVILITASIVHLILMLLYRGAFNV